jgi:ABC-2 type transport system ATP-binding protein
VAACGGDVGLSSFPPAQRCDFRRIVVESSEGRAGSRLGRTVEPMISVDNLTKRYGSGPPSVDGVSFTCAPGTVTGFLGPNGAGKSTTLRALCGLTPPTSGSATINGTRYTDLPNPGRVVGVMLDASAQHPGRTGRETMRLAGMLLGVPRDRTDAMLERVGLQGAVRRRVRDYSLGMRQRLGIGQALLGDPSVLVLDEPANGLDPEGIRWMRGLLRDFAAAGGTVLVSSHLLREVEATVDRLVVIDHGRIIAHGTMSELAHQSGGGSVIVRGLDPAGLAAAMLAAGVEGACQADGALLVRASAEQVGRAAYSAGQVLTELKAADAAGLEDLFFRLTAQNGTDSGALTAAGARPSAPEEVPA